MRNRTPTASLIALVVFALDQLDQMAGHRPARHHADRRPASMLLPIFNFTYTENNGISLGLLNATDPIGRWMLVALTRAIAVGVACLDRAREEPGRPDRARDGARRRARQILDRVRLGYVVDFADLHFGDFRPFLVFNVGDAAISIGVVILLLRAFLTRKDQARARPEETIEHA